MVDNRRVRALNDRPVRQGPVVYWMSRDQRVADNWALLYAQGLAAERQQPLAVAFLAGAHLPRGHAAAVRVHARRPGGGGAGAARARHPLPPAARRPSGRRADRPRADRHRPGRATRSRGGCDRLRPVAGGPAVPGARGASARRGPARSRCSQYRTLLGFVRQERVCGLHAASEAAATARRVSDGVPGAAAAVLRRCAGGSGGQLAGGARLVARPGDGRPRTAPAGARAAGVALATFVREGLAGYPATRNDPNLDGQSDLSPYLHFGQIAPHRVALGVRAAGGVAQASKAAFFEDLIVRRELADNFCAYEPAYDAFTGFPAWAQTRASLSIPASNWRTARPTTSCGTRPRNRCWQAGRCTVT